MSSEPPERLQKRRSTIFQLFQRRLTTAQKIDTLLFEKVNALPHLPIIDKTMEWIAILMNRGDGWLIGLLLLELRKWWRGVPTNFRFVWRTACLLWLVTATVEFVLKAIFRRKRPFVQIAHARLVGAAPRHHSFPSGHTASSFAALWLLRKYSPRWGWLRFVIALIIALNRIYIGAHFPADTLAGAASGVGLAAFYEMIAFRGDRTHRRRWLKLR